MTKETSVRCVDCGRNATVIFEVLKESNYPRRGSWLVGEVSSIEACACGWVPDDETVQQAVERACEEQMEAPDEPRFDTLAEKRLYEMD